MAVATMSNIKTSVEDIAALFPMGQPLEVMRLTQGFGQNLVPFYRDLGIRGHNGRDYAALSGTKTFSVLDGTVRYAAEKENDGYGYAVVLQTPTRKVDGLSCAVEVIYAHLQRTIVKTGEKVTVGQHIADCDNTGKHTTGSHLHLGTRIIYFIDGQEHRAMHNGYFGYSDPSLFLTRNIRYDAFPVDFRYEQPRKYLAERVFAFSPVTRRALGRLPTSREVRAAVYGEWSIPHIVDPAMFITWAELTHDEYRQRLRAMVSQP